jgi:hypothetical protein
MLRRHETSCVHVCCVVPPAESYTPIALESPESFVAGSSLRNSQSNPTYREISFQTNQHGLTCTCVCTPMHFPLSKLLCKPTMSYIVVLLKYARLYMQFLFSFDKRLCRCLHIAPFLSCHITYDQFFRCCVAAKPLLLYVICHKSTSNLNEQSFACT